MLILRYGLRDTSILNHVILFVATKTDVTADVSVGQT